MDVARLLIPFRLIVLVCFVISLLEYRCKGTLPTRRSRTLLDRHKRRIQARSTRLVHAPPKKLHRRPTLKLLLRQSQFSRHPLIQLPWKQKPHPKSRLLKMLPVRLRQLTVRQQRQRRPLQHLQRSKHRLPPQASGLSRHQNPQLVSRLRPLLRSECLQSVP